MNSEPDFSLIVLAYRSENVILDCIDSIIKQKTEYKFEIIVVNSYPDRTLDLVPMKYPDINLIHSTTRLFPGAARNRGIEAASGKIIAFLASDCTLSTNWVNRRIHHHRKGFSCVGGSVHMFPTKNPISLCEYWIEYSNFMKEKKPYVIRDKTPHNLSYSKGIFQKYGFFIESIRAGEDTLFNKKLIEAQENILFDPQIIMFHRGSKHFSSFFKHIFTHGKEITRFLALDTNNRWNRFTRKRQFLSLSVILVLKRIFITYVRIFRCGPIDILLGLLYAPLLLTGICFLSYGALRTLFTMRTVSS